MTREEAIDKLLNECVTGDPECDHGRADGVLLEFLKSNGFEDVVDAWEETRDKADFWYA